MDDAGTNRQGGPTETGESPQRIEAIVAALQLATETDLPAVLQQLVNLAREVVPARYAALGVADEHGKIQQFITSGLSAAARNAIGPLPQGHGMLGALIQDRQPLLVPDIAADPRSVGFPPNHPPMTTLIGVPVMLGNQVLGDLYLTEREHGTEFTEEDLAALRILAVHAATTIERARLLAQSRAAHVQATEQRDQLETILHSMPTAVLLLRNPDAAVELANPAAGSLVFGNRYARGLPQPYRDYTFLDSDGTPVPEHHWPCHRALAGEMVRNKQLDIRTGDNRRIPVLVQAAPLRDSAGMVRRAVLILQDITKLREAEQLKDDFLSLVSHEMRTPLTAIHGGASLLVSHGDTLDEGTRRELLDDILVESTRLERTLANILALTGIQSGRVEPATEPILVRAFLREALAAVGSQVAGHQLEVTVPSGLPIAEGDPELLSHVIRNLIENAARYSPPGTTIQVSARRVGEEVAISVTDQGHGIAAEHLPFVFDRFRRVGADPTIRGMGLGLYLSRHLVDAQGGTLSVQSPGPGLGATFTVTLPIAAGWSDSELEETS